MTHKKLVTPPQRKKIACGASYKKPLDKVITVQNGEELPLLQCRCLLSNFAKRIKIWQMNDREWELLRTTPFGRLIEGIVEIDMNVEILDALLGFWDKEHCAFVIGGNIVPFTAHDVALITGLPNRGHKVVRQRSNLNSHPEKVRIYMSVTQIERRLDSILQDTRIIPSSETDSCFVQQMILYLWGSVLFPSSGRVVPNYMSQYVKDLEAIGNYNWAEAVHSFLVKEINNVKSKLLKQRNGGKKVAAGFINGPCFIINVWFFEHVDFGDDSRPSNPDARPRMLKWTKICKLWRRKPFLQRFREIVEDKVSFHILPNNDELELLSLDDMGHMASQIGDSDDALRDGPSKHGNLENVGSDINLGYERTNLKILEAENVKMEERDKYFSIKYLAELIHKQNEKIGRIPVLEGRIVKLETLALSNGWKIEDETNSMDGLSEHKDGEVDEDAHDGKINREVNEQDVCHLNESFNESFFLGSYIDGGKVLAAERIGKIEVKKGRRRHGKRKVLMIPNAKKHLVLKRRKAEKMQASISVMRNSTGLGRKDTDILVDVDDYTVPIKQKKELKFAPLNYVGRELLTENEREFLDSFCIKPMQGDDIVFFDWNIAIRRHSMVEYLRGGYTGEEIIDAYARFLYKSKVLSGSNFSSFLYVPPMFLGLYRNKLGSYKSFLNYVHKNSLEKVKFLFLPCLVPTANHWLLLVCDMQIQKWIVYDSLYDPRHRNAVKEQIMLIAEYLYQEHLFDIRPWGLEYMRIYPQQEPGTLDCGIFVMKFIENIVQYNFRKVINFQGTDMQLFRPQIAYRILCQKC